jgi:predicted hydrocarbon binding protein
MVGYIETMIALGHGKNVRVQHSNCRAHGADACVFEATWR